MKKHEPMTEERLAAIKARAEAATPGPWHHVLAAIVGTTPCPDDDNTTCICNTDWGNSTNIQPNAAFIAHAREDVPALLEEVERLRAREEWLAGQVAVHSEHYGETPFCIMPSEYKCKWNNIDFCQASVKKRAECWRKAADMATRENTGEEMKGHEQ